MFLLLLIAICVLSCAAYIIGDKYCIEPVETLGGICGWVSGFSIIVSCIVLIFSYGTSLDTVSNLANFYDRNYKIWQVAIEKYPNAVVIDTKGETAKTTNLSRDFIHNVLKYNRDLQWYQLYENHWFYDTFITTVDKRLKFLEIPPR